MQGVLGIDIGPLTFGELVRAFKAKQDYDLTQTSALLAEITNAPHWKPRRQAKAADFYKPNIKHRQQPKAKLTPDLLRSYKPLFKKR